VPIDTFTTLWNRLQLRAPAVGPALAQDLIRDAFQQLAERRTWSWRRSTSSFFPNIFYNTGTATVTFGSPYITGVGTTWAANFVGTQFRGGSIPSAFPTYTILAVLSPTSVLLDKPWAGASSSGLQYQIFQCYFPVPSDFQSFESLTNPTNSFQIWTNLTQAELDRMDPQRVTSGVVYAAAFYDYTANYQGTIGPVFQVGGTGAAPVSTTTTGYSYPSASTYVIQITTGGTVGSVIFEWRQDNGAYTTNVAVLNSNPIILSNGVQVYFPAGTYNLGDIFIINASTEPVPSVPRYELWPRPINAFYVLPYLYIKLLPELTDAQPQLPPFVAQRGDVLLEMALQKCAQWPGTASMPNPYYNLQLAERHRITAEQLINELEKYDDNTGLQDITYQNWPFYPAPWLDGRWNQDHAIY
jgi:hypothetical protein